VSLDVFFVKTREDESRERDEAVSMLRHALRGEFEDGMGASFVACFAHESLEESATDHRHLCFVWSRLVSDLEANGPRECRRVLSFLKNCIYVFGRRGFTLSARDANYDEFFRGEPRKDSTPECPEVVVDIFKKGNHQDLSLSA
jgi:hypothetical protein